MKKLLFLMMLVSFHGYSQITKIETGIEARGLRIEPYDSLSNIDSYNYAQHIGQTLFLKKNNFDEKRGGYSGFHTTYSFRLGFSVQNIYKPVENEKYGTSSSDYNALKEKYFFVADIILSPNKDDFYTKDKGFLKLVEKESGDIVYYAFDSGSRFSNFLTVGYFEKLKQNCVGKKYVHTGELRGFREDDRLRKISDNNELFDVAKGTIFECLDVSLRDSEYQEIIAVLENEKYGRVFIGADLIDKIEAVSTVLKPQEFMEMQAQRELLLAKKYGKSNASKIMNMDIVVGWNKEMCRESWGSPLEINRTSGSFGVHEQWVYTSSYLYFEGDILTAIQD